MTPVTTPKAERTVILCPIGTCRTCDEVRRLEREARCPSRRAFSAREAWKVIEGPRHSLRGHLRRWVRWYVGLWRECFADDDPFVLFLARAQLICLNAGVGFAMLMLLAWSVHFWRLYV